MSAKRRLIEAVEVTEEGIHIVRLMKVFDASSLDEFEKVLAYLLSRNHYRIVVDLTSVEFISSAGWGAFTAELRRVRDNGGDIRLAGMNPDVLDVFLLLELDSFINAYDTIDDAILSFDAAAEHPSQQDYFSGAGAAFPPAEPAAQDHGAYDSSLLPHELEQDQHDAAESYEDAYAGGFEQPSSHPSRDAASSEPLSDAERLSQPNAAAEPDLLSAVGDEFFNWSPYGSGGAASLENKHTAAPEDFEASPEANFDYEGSSFENEEEPLDHSGLETQEDLDDPGKSSMWAGDFSEEANESPATAMPPHAVAQDSFEALDPKPGARASGASAPAEQFFDDFASQDINDPWILDEIDTLPEEYEMEEVNWRDDSDYAEPTPTFLEEKKDAPDEYPVANPAKSKGFAAATENANAVKQAATQEIALKDYMSAWGAQKKTAPAAATPAAVPENGSRQEFSVPQKPFVHHASAPQRSAEAPASAPAIAHVDQQSKQAFRNGPQPIRKLQTAQRMQFDGDRSTLIRQIVSEHPHYGPTMIQKFLEVRIEPAISVSRSTVYRWLRQEELNTREQRLQFAGRATTN